MRSDLIDELVPDHHGSDAVESFDIRRQLAPIDPDNELPLVLPDTDPSKPNPASQPLGHAVLCSPGLRECRRILHGDLSISRPAITFGSRFA
jgi:hypothetical protein